MGQKGDGSEEAAATQTDISRRLFGESTGLRKGIIGELEAILGFPQTTQPGEEANRPTGVLEGAFRPAREALESQYGVAREQVLSSVPGRGGQLNQMLSDVALERAGAVSGLKGQLINQAFNQALGLSTQMPALALGGLGSAGQLQSASANRRLQRDIAIGQAVGESSSNKMAIGL